MSKTIHISVIEITADLRNGTPDTELMKKYGHSETNLKRVFDRLLRAMSEGSRQIKIESDGSEPLLVGESLSTVELGRR